MRDEERYVFWCQREDRPAIVLPIRRMRSVEPRVDQESAGSGLRCSGCGLADVPIDGDELHGFLCRVRETELDPDEPSPGAISSAPTRAADRAGLPIDASDPVSPDGGLRLAIGRLERRVEQLELRAGAMRSDAQRRVLGVLADLRVSPLNDGSETMRPAQICDCTGLPRGEVGRALEALRRAGFVEWTRASGSGDWRATEEGVGEVEFCRDLWGSTGTRAR